MRAAERSFWLLLALAGAALLAPLALAWRLLPCQVPIGHAISSACRLLAGFGLGQPEPIGAALLLLALAAGAGVVGRLGRERAAAARLARRAALASARCPARLAAWARRAGLGDRLAVLRSDRPVAFCAGLVRPRVYLTTGLLAVLGQRELAAVLHHEVHHAIRRDPLRIALARALAGAVFYLPLLRDLEAHFLVAKEVEADQAALAALGDRAALARALLVLAGAPGAPAPPASTLPPHASPLWPVAIARRSTCGRRAW